MSYRRRVTFWAWLILGWLITACILSLAARFASLEELPQPERVAIGVAVHFLSAVAGYTFARQRVRMREGRGFPIVPGSGPLTANHDDRMARAGDE